MEKKIPFRQCVGCGQMKEKKNLIRIVRMPDGTFEIDESGKKNGRGAYICKNRECFAKMKKSHGLDRSFKMRVPETIYEALLSEANAYE